MPTYSGSYVTLESVESEKDIGVTIDAKLLAYSRIGLTSDLNNKQNVLKSKYLNDLLIIPTI
jgi:hypothetical protein